MKLAEALNLRTTLVKEIAELRRRLVDCVNIQEGETPIDSAEELLKEIEPLTNQLHRLVYQINLTNIETKDNGKSITELLAERDELGLRTSILNEALRRLNDNKMRYHSDDIRYIRTVEPSFLRDLLSKESAKLRKINLKIQMLGWTHNLIEK